MIHIDRDETPFSSYDAPVLIFKIYYNRTFIRYDQTIKNDIYMGI